MKKITDLTLGVKRLEGLVQRIEESTVPERIEVDLLLQELRTMYMTTLELRMQTCLPLSSMEPLELMKPSDTKATTESQNTVHSQEEQCDINVQEAAFNSKKDATEATKAVGDSDDKNEFDPEVEAQSLMQDIDEGLFESNNDEEVAVKDENLEMNSETEAPSLQQTQSESNSEKKSATEVVSVRQVGNEDKETTGTKKQREQKVESSLFDYISFDNPRDGGSTGSEANATMTLGDKIGGSSHELRGEQAQYKHVTDLRTIININDKFSFMKNLFHNNMKAYNDFILELNSITDRTTAETCVERVAQVYGWDKSSLTVKKFYGIFDRKF